MPNKPIARPWAVLTDGVLIDYGNGEQFQFPLFHTRKEAREWIAISAYRGERCAVVRVEVYLAKR